MIIDEALQAEKPQPGITMEFKTRDPIVLRAVLLMQQNIDQPCSVAEIARRIGHSKRQLERHLQASLKISPRAAFLSMRLSLAHHLIQISEKSISQIALDCGFCDSSHLSRMFRRRFGSTPLALRHITGIQA